jgi:hypothetical protein
MNRTTMALAVCGVLVAAGTIGADTNHTESQHLTVPFNAQATAKNGIAFAGVIAMPPPVTMKVPPGSTMQLGPGTTIAINGPVTFGGRFLFSGTVTIPKGTVLMEAPVASSPAQSKPHEPSL